MAEERLLVAGLGNPGEKYERTRHNAGFLAIDNFAAGLGISAQSEKMQGLYAGVRVEGRQVILLKPQTFMNRSGQCVAGFARYFNIEPGNIMVIHDDLDLEPGRIKIAPGGGAGGHKGIRSVISHLGTDAFCRFKLGIGRPYITGEGRGQPVEKYVLSPFTEEQWRIFRENLAAVDEGIRLFVTGGAGAAMNKINGRNRRETRD